MDIVREWLVFGTARSLPLPGITQRCSRPGFELATFRSPVWHSYFYSIGTPILYLFVTWFRLEPPYPYLIWRNPQPHLIHSQTFHFDLISTNDWPCYKYIKALTIGGDPRPPGHRSIWSPVPPCYCCDTCRPPATPSVKSLLMESGRRNTWPQGTGHVTTDWPIRGRGEVAFSAELIFTQSVPSVTRQSVRLKQGLKRFLSFIAEDSIVR